MLIYFHFSYQYYFRPTPAPCPEGTRYCQKPTASSEGAQLWDKHPLTLSWFRKAGPTIILTIIGNASVPLRGTHFGGIIFTHSGAASQLAVGFHYIDPAPRNPYIILNQLCSWVRGYGEDAIASYVCIRLGATEASANMQPTVFLCFSVYGCVLCTNKRLYVRLSRTGSRKT